MKKPLIVLFTYGILIALAATAQLGTTIIHGVQRSRLERVLRDRMDVHMVSIIEMKEKKIENVIDGILSLFDNEMVERKGYVFKLLVDESLLNKQKHVVDCDVYDNTKGDDLLFVNCKSATSTVQNMLLSKVELR